MRGIIVTAIALVLSASMLHFQEGSPGSFLHEPNPIIKISQALTESGIDELTPKLYLSNQRRYSYHLSSVRHLGSLSRQNQHFMMAAVLFIRSSPENAELPPARGHGFLLLLDKENRLASYCRVDFPDQIELLDGKLYRLGTIPFEGKRGMIADLTLTDIAVRSSGFLIDGDAILPYPFSDRVVRPEAAPETK